jgi:hypothetical protein
MTGAAMSSSPDWAAELWGANLRIAELEGALYMVTTHRQFIIRCLRSNATADGAGALLVSRGLKRSHSDSSHEGVRASRGLASALLQPLIPSVSGPLPLVPFVLAHDGPVDAVVKEEESQRVEPEGPKVKRKYVRTPGGQCPRCFREGRGLRPGGTQHPPACPKALSQREEKTCPACKKKTDGKPQGSAKHILDCEHRPVHKKVSGNT